MSPDQLLVSLISQLFSVSRNSIEFFITIHTKNHHRNVNDINHKNMNNYPCLEP